MARMIRWVAVALVLLAPLVAMAFTREVAWTPRDFAVAALLLGGGMVTYELVAPRIRRPQARALATVGLAALVAGVWAEGAVGILS